MFSECSRFHPNRFTFGGVIPERLNTVKTGRKVNPILSWSLVSSLIIRIGLDDMTTDRLYLNCISTLDTKRQTDISCIGTIHVRDNFYTILHINFYSPTMISKAKSTRMWANAQHDGRPAEYTWRPLFHSAVWLTPTTRVPCSNAAKTRNPLKLPGVPQTNETISAVWAEVHHIVWTCRRDSAA